jgi:hypothetical protein
MSFELYFDISWFIAYVIAGISIPVITIRLLRAFPYYVKNGGLGHKNNTIWLGDQVSFRNQIINFLTETHPEAAMTDVLALSLIGLGLFIAWGLIPFILFGMFSFYGVRWLARHMRDQYLAKQEFHRKLKGT